MGTNFYLLGKPACEHCSRRAERGLHIGKSSAGWCFSLHIPSEWECSDAGVPPISGLADWIPLFERFGVIDEYGDAVSASGMLSIITERDGYRGRDKPNGPLTLRRHPVDGYHCIANGDGSYDLMIGEFS